MIDEKNMTKPVPETVSQPKPQTVDDPQLKAMRQRMITIIPEMAEQIKQMNKNDLNQLLEMAHTQNQQSTGNDGTKQQFRGDKMKQILKQFPEMRAELQLLDDKDVDQIYKQIKHQNGKPQAQSQEFPASQRSMQTNNFSQSGANSTVNGSKNQQQQLNVYQMKKSLISRLPEYRNQIRNLADQEIKKMYLDLQEEENRSGRKPQQQQQQQRRNKYPDQSQQFGLNNVKAQNYPSNDGRMNSSYGMNQIHSKRDAKIMKQKHKCKVTFYLDSEDFGPEGIPEDKGTGLKKIIDGLSRAFQNKQAK